MNRASDVSVDECPSDHTEFATQFHKSPAQSVQSDPESDHESFESAENPDVIDDEPAQVQDSKEIAKFRFGRNFRFSLHSFERSPSLVSGMGAKWPERNDAAFAKGKEVIEACRAFAN
jgi:hypothetical protein